MERLIFICVSGLVAVSMYITFARLVRNEEGRSFVITHFWLQPNWICLWRVILGWIGIYLYFFTSCIFSAILLFTCAAVLDAVDGLIARKCKLVSDLGEELDPLADKLTYLPAMVFFAYFGQLSIYWVWVFVAIEMMGQFGVRHFCRKLNWPVAANNFGKIKAVFCFLLVIYLTLLDDRINLPDVAAQILAACITLGICSAAIKMVPNYLYADILSVLNMGCGGAGIFLAMKGHFVQASIAIIAGQLFDLFDGRMARLHGGTKVGPLFDDAADFISFGICPAVIISSLGEWKLWPIIMSVIFISALGFRLYRFAQKDKKNPNLAEGIFNGLPGPAGAMIIIGACLFWEYSIKSQILVLLTSALMVSRIRFAHLGKYILPRLPRTAMIIIASVVIAVILFLIRQKDPVLLGLLLLILSTIYVLGFNSFVRKI